MLDVSARPLCKGRRLTSPDVTSHAQECVGLSDIGIKSAINRTSKINFTYTGAHGRPGDRESGCLLLRGVLVGDLDVGRAGVPGTQPAGNFHRSHERQSAPCSARRCTPSLVSHTLRKMPIIHVMRVLHLSEHRVPLSNESLLQSSVRAIAPFWSQSAASLQSKSACSSGDNGAPCLEIPSRRHCSEENVTLCSGFVQDGRQIHDEIVKWDCALAGRS